MVETMQKYQKVLIFLLREKIESQKCSILVSLHGVFDALSKKIKIAIYTYPFVIEVAISF